MRFASLIPLIFSALSFAVALYFLFLSSGQSNNLQSAYGNVITKNEQHITVGFTAASGQQIAFESQSELTPYYEVGESIHVLYDATQPEKALDSANSTHKDRALLVLMGLIACAFGLIIFTKVGGAEAVGQVTAGRFLLSGVAIILIAYGVWGAYKVYEDKSVLLQTQGQVVAVLKVQSNAEQPGNYDHNQVTYYPVVKFSTAEQQKWTMKSNEGYPVPPYQVGDVVTVSYNANAPQMSMLSGTVTPWVLMAVSFVVGVSCLVLGLRVL